MEQTTSSHKIDLSPFDQTIPRLYVHKLFCFPFADSERQPETVQRLEQALSATILRWPAYITGSISPAKTGAQRNEVELRYTTPVVGETAKNILIAKRLTASEFPWTYRHLCDAGVPPSAMNKDVLSIVPEWPKHGEMYPALAIQANFIDGGLILCFAFHHAVADGSSFCTFLKAFAAATKNPPTTKFGMQMAVNQRLKYIRTPELEVAALESFPEYNFKNAPMHRASLDRITNRILTFSAITVQKLENAIKLHLGKSTASPMFVSNIACLSSLIWVAVIRARQGRLDPAETTKMGIAVNARSVMNPKLPEEYFGNVVVHTNATAKVFELLHNLELNNGTIESSITIPTLALAASRMREAVQNVDSNYVNERLKTFSALPDPTETSRAYTRAMDTSNTGLDFSSWRDQGADVEFDIPGVGCSTVAFWRKAWSPNEGAYNILPRKGGSKGPADWEISLGLSVGDMEVVCSKGELGAWVSRIVE